MSKSGWVKAAKGHDVEASQLTFRSGDGFLAAVQGKSNQVAIFLDSTGRSYSVPTHLLPSARGHGEPLTGKVTPPDGAQFVGLLLGHDDEHVLIASDAGYGFVTTLAEMQTRNKTGKTLLSLPPGAKVLPPVRVLSLTTDRVVAITNEGRMLLFPIAELPLLNKGKGNKIIGIPSSAVADRSEYVSALTVLPEGSVLKIYSGQRHYTIKPSDFEHYLGERGRRGNKLPRGLQSVERVEVAEK